MSGFSLTASTSHDHSCGTLTASTSHDQSCRLHTAFHHDPNRPLVHCDNNVHCNAEGPRENDSFPSSKHNMTYLRLNIGIMRSRT